MKAIAGCLALLTYMALFTGGVALNSRPYRDQLLGKEPGGTISPAPVASDRSLLASEASMIGPAKVVPSAAVEGPPGRPLPLTRDTAVAFLAVMLLYTPVNIGFLAMLAGFIGGCASSMTFAQGPGGATGTAANMPGDDNPYRQESPFASMIRSFIVYLAMLAGTYVIADNPFSAPTSEQYVRMAASVSLFAFVVGYDPTKFRDWLDRLPKPATK
jgi:hypothetical protein